LNTATSRHAEVAASVQAKRDELAPQKTAFQERELAFAEADKAARAAAAQLQATDQALADKRPLAESLAAALSAAQRAAELVPGDETLKSAVGLLQGRHEKIAAEIAPLEKAQPEHKQAVDTTLAAQAAEQQQLDEARSQWSAGSAPLSALELQQARAADEVRQADNAVQLAKRRMSDAKLLAEMKPVLDEALAAQSALSQLDTELGTAQQQAAGLRQRLTQLETDQGAMRTQAEALAADLASVTKRQADATQAQALVQQATEKLRQASAALPDDGGLQSAAQDLAARSERLAQQVSSGAADVAAREKRMREVNELLTALEQSLSDVKSQATAAQQLVSDVQARRDQAQANCVSLEGRREEALSNIEQRWTRQAALAPLKPLTPEQLAWSMMQATGVLAAQRQASENELQQNAEIAADPARLAAEVEKHAFAKLEGNVNEFVRLFGGGAGQPQNEFFATVDQALFFANGGVLRSWLAPSGENLTARLIKLEDPAAVAEELYLSVLSRRPETAEIERTVQTLTAAPQDKAAVVQELAWALMTSAEFRFRP
jgi:chromosome segregation ATPase